MPNFQSAKTIAENALTTIGAFPASMSQADEGELKKTLQWLEMLLNTQTAIRPMHGFFRVVDIPLEANVGDYDLSDYADSAEAQNVFSVCLVDNNGTVVPLDIEYESKSIEENLSNTGTPRRVYVSTDAVPVLKVFPMPVTENEQSGQVLRVRIQTYHPALDRQGAADEDILVRPSWYLWLTKSLAYEIGLGPVRRLSEGELNRLQNDAARLEGLLLAGDSRRGAPRPPVTEPMPGSV